MDETKECFGLLIGCYYIYLSIYREYSLPFHPLLMWLVIMVITVLIFIDTHNPTHDGEMHLCPAMSGNWATGNLEPV